MGVVAVAGGALVEGATALGELVAVVAISSAKPARGNPIESTTILNKADRQEKQRIETLFKHVRELKVACDV